MQIKIKQKQNSIESKYGAFCTDNKVSDHALSLAFLHDKQAAGP